MALSIENQQRVKNFGSATVMTATALVGVVAARAMKTMPTYTKWVKYGAFIGVPLTGLTLVRTSQKTDFEDAANFMTNPLVLTSYAAFLGISLPINIFIGKGWNGYARFITALSGFAAVTTVGQAWAGALRYSLPERS